MAERQGSERIDYGDIVAQEREGGKKGRGDEGVKGGRSLCSDCIRKEGKGQGRMFTRVRPSLGARMRLRRINSASATGNPLRRVVWWVPVRFNALVVAGVGCKSAHSFFCCYGLGMISR